MRFSARFSGLLALIVGFALLTGCGETVIDQASLEDTVQQDIEKQGTPVEAVECPSDQEVVVGATFTCTVEYSDGGEATATLRIRNKDADLSMIDLRAK